METVQTGLLEFIIILGNFYLVYKYIMDDDDEWHLYDTNVFGEEFPGIPEIKEIVNEWEVIQYDEISGMGCAMNVLAFLKVVTNETAKEEITSICLSTRPPKNNGTQSSEIVAYLQLFSGYHLSYDTISFLHHNTSIFNINQALSAFFYLKNNMTSGRVIIIKLHYGSNFHHTLLLLKTPHDEIYTVDVQLNHVRKIDATLTSVSNKTHKWLSKFQGISFYITDDELYPTPIMTGIYPTVIISQFTAGGHNNKSKSKQRVTILRKTAKTITKQKTEIEAPVVISRLLYTDISNKNLKTITSLWAKKRDLQAIKRKIKSWEATSKMVSL